MNRPDVMPEHELNKILRYRTTSLNVKPNSPALEPFSYLSALGQIVNGHGISKKKAYPETCILDLLHLLPNKGVSVRNYVANEILGISNLMYEMVNIVTGQKLPEDSSLYNSKTGHLKLLTLGKQKRVPFDFLNYANYEIRDPLSFVCGAYLMSQVDNFDHRQRVSENYEKIGGGKLIIGGGEVHTGNLETICQLEGFKLKTLTKDNVSDELINYLYKYDILKKEIGYFAKGKFSENLFEVYIKKINEFGCSDDAMISTIGRIFKFYSSESARDAMIGAAIIDNVDTIRNISSGVCTGGADEAIGNIMNTMYVQKMGVDICPEKYIDAVIFGGAKNNNKLLRFSSSSTKLNKKQMSNNRKMITPLEAHIKFVMDGIDTQDLGLGHDGFPSSKFYHVMRDIRWPAMEEIGLLEKIT